MRRREFIEKMAMAAVAVPCAAIADETYEGVVLGGGKPLRGVVVTDGLNCTTTDGKGRFKLPKRPLARFLSVTVPSGWRAETAHYLPVSAGAFEFRLVPWAASAAGRGCAFLQLTDSETAGLGWVKQLKAAADRDDVAFVVHTGDICRKDGMEAHARELNGVTVGRPVYYCVGNHDLSGEDGTGESVFEGLFGPCWHSFDAGGIHFVVTPMADGDHKPSYTHEMVADWMRNDLAYVPKGRPVVVFSHMLTHSWSAATCGRRIGCGAGELNIARSCNLAAFVYGHTHHSYFRRREGVALISTSTPNKGGISHDPAVFRIVRVAPDGKTVAKSVFHPKADWTLSRAGAAWETDLGAPVLCGAPAFADNRIFVGTLDDDGLGTGAVVALGAGNGKVRWRAPMANSVKGSVVHFDGKVFAQDADGHVCAFSAADGSPVWTHELKDMAWRPVMAGLEVDREKGVLYAGFGERLCALNAGTGAVIWSGPKGWKDGGEPVNTRPALGAGVLVSCAQWRGIHANDAATGDDLWFASKNGEFGCGARPLIVGDRVYALGGKNFNEYELRTGKLLRSKTFDFKVEMPTGVLAADGKYVFGSWDGLCAVDAKTFEIAWRIPADEALVVNAAYCWGGASVTAAPVAVDATTGVFAAQDGKIRVFRFADGSVMRTIGTGAPYFASPTVVKGALFAADFAGRVRAWRLG